MRRLVLLCLLLLTLVPRMTVGQTTNAVPAFDPAPKPPPKNYLLTANDVVHIKVFQEDDLETRARISQDGTITFPLVGLVEIGGKTLDQAGEIIRELLAKDYLVNPQVSMSIVEYAKRRFTIMGQVQRPNTYEFPENQTLNLLQAIAMAGSYTRIANPGKVTVQRQEGDKKLTFTLDARAMTKDKSMKVFEILPDDLITVSESVF